MSHSLLIVDDHAIVRRGLRSLLSNYPEFEIVGEAGSCDEGFEMFRALRPDVSLVDIRLGDRSGLDLLDDILNEDPEARVLIVSSFSDDEYVTRSLRAGALGYVSKADSPSVLVTAIETVASGQQAIGPGVAAHLVEQLISPTATTGPTLEPTEVQMLAMVANGASNSQIADRLYMSDSTVKRRLHRVFEKLGVGRRTEAVAEALRQGLLWRWPDRVTRLTQPGHRLNRGFRAAASPDRLQLVPFSLRRQRTMFPAAFDYSAPSSVDEALANLSEVGEDGRVLAGGQSLIPMMKLRLAAPANLVDINGIAELDYINDVNGHIAIGALARHAAVAASDLIRSNNGTMAAAAPWIADPLVRNRGTLCGSVAHCDPEGDWNSVMLAIGASVVARSQSGERVIPIADFVVDFFTNSLQPGEMVTEVRVPKYTGSAGGSYIKLERKIGDYATVGVATHLQLDSAGKIAQAGLALTSVYRHNLKVGEAEQMMIGQDPSAELFAEAGDIAARACDPESDVRGPADYKRAVVKEYTKRGFAQTLAQVGGQS